MSVDGFSACVLADKFFTRHIKLHPGRSFPELEAKARLAGGFSTMFPDSSFPLSPALQLNHDLARLSHENLEQFAKAEEIRLAKSSCKTYVVDPSFHVCVIAAQVGQLDDFLDTYGGILEIEPLLFGENHAGYAQLAELEIKKAKDGYQIMAGQRSPVSENLCNYCGSCGQLCPESCIAPDLRIDFNSCSFCRKCETACAAGAIDIYGVTRKTIHAPAIILLDEVKVELPEERSGIFTMESLPQYLSTLFSTKIEEAVTCNQDLCQYSSKLKKGCTICRQSCQHGAISIKNGSIAIDYHLCTECGQCISACPTGAMQFERFGDSAFASFFNIFKIRPGMAAVIGNEQQLHQLWWQHRGTDNFAGSFFLEYPEPAALSAFHFLHLVRQGAARIIILSDSKKNQAEGRANDLLKSFFDCKDVVQQCTVETIIQELQNSKDIKSLMPTSASDIPFNNRRVNLAGLLKDFHGQAAADVYLTREEHGAFATITCDDQKCTQCFACLNECKVQALKAGAGAMSLTRNVSLCVGCGVCTAVCPEQALFLRGGAVVSSQFFEDVELAKTEPMLCRECGKEFGSKKSFERVMAILSDKNMTDKGHFEYCETCRVIKMFEAA
ncbi:MAG: hypothetical protein CSB24_06915 [Deltaproteobacteria bacterium]|nr:MAG: hypothetical protein CSB24_06915 [Deltaproteobacteria bacterium]